MMLIAVTLFRLLLPLVAIYALLRGGRDERLVAFCCVAGALLTQIVVSPLGDRFESVEWPILLVDLGVFAGFVGVALRSQRFWPLWVAGLQLTTIMGHLIKQVASDLLPTAYGVALGFWAYPIIFILAIGTWRHTRRMRRHADPTPA